MDPWSRTAAYYMAVSRRPRLRTAPRQTDRPLAPPDRPSAPPDTEDGGLPTDRQVGSPFPGRPSPGLAGRPRRTRYTGWSGSRARLTGGLVARGGNNARKSLSVAAAGDGVPQTKKNNTKGDPSAGQSGSVCLSRVTQRYKRRIPGLCPSTDSNRKHSRRSLSRTVWVGVSQPNVHKQ